MSPDSQYDHSHPLDPVAVGSARDELIDAEEAGRLAGFLALIADPVRSRLLLALSAAGEMCVGDLAMALSASDDAVSYGLRLLRTAGFVRSRKEGRVVFYRLTEDVPWTRVEGVMSELLDLSSTGSKGTPS